MNCLNELHIKPFSCIQVLPGNTNANGIQTNLVQPAFHARYVRIHPKSWVGRICLRLELYGCESTGKDEGTSVCRNEYMYITL